MFPGKSSDEMDWRMYCRLHTCDALFILGVIPGQVPGRTILQFRTKNRMSSNQQRTSTPRSRKTSKGPNKSQLRAAEVRARQTHEAIRQPATVVTSVAEPIPVLGGDVATIPATDIVRQRSGVRVTSAGKSRAKGKVSALNVHKLTREQEYTFIKADLRRLLITAGSLAAVMVVLLFIIER